MGIDGNEPGAITASDLDANIQTYFTDYEEVARGEAAILLGQGNVIKLYAQQYPYSVIDRYRVITNKLADASQGMEINIEMPDSSSIPFSVIVNPVLEVKKLPTGLVYTNSRFIPGPNLEKATDYARSFGSVNFITSILCQHAYATGRIIVSQVEMGLKELVDKHDDIAIRIHPQNIKIFGDGKENRVEVTDISSSIRLLI